MQNETIGKKSKYIIHLIYASTLLFAVLIFVIYFIWKENHIETQRMKRLQWEANQKQLDLKQRAFQEKEQRIKVINCMNNSQLKYTNSIARLCSHPNINYCQLILARGAPKLLDPLINTLHKDQKICVKMAGKF